MSGTAVIIVGFRNPTDILACLEGLIAQSTPVARVVICENGGDAHAQGLRNAIADRIPASLEMTVVSAPDNPGYAGGINRALDEVPEADPVWILNPDAIPRPGAHREMLNELEQGGYDAVGGVICTSEGVVKTCGGGWRVQTGYVSALAHGRTLATLPAKSEIEPHLAFISGANMLATRRFIAVAGRMREDYFLYAEEVEWCLRASRKGLRLGYCPTALIEHEQGTATGSVAPHRHRPQLPIYLDTRNRVLTVRDTQPAWLITAAPAILASVALRYLARGALRQFGHALAGWMAGLRNERGKPTWIA